jgi:hypothetical protein
MENYWQGAYAEAYDQRAENARNKNVPDLYNDLVYRYSNVLGSPEKLIGLSSRLNFGEGVQMQGLKDQGFSNEEINYVGYSTGGGSSDRRPFGATKGNIGLYQPDQFLPTDLHDTTIEQHEYYKGSHSDVAYDENTIGQALDNHKKLDSKDRIRMMKNAEIDKVSQATLEIMINARNKRLAEMEKKEKGEETIEDPEKVITPSSEYPTFTPEWEEVKARETVTNEILVRKVVQEALKRSFKK